MLPVQFHTKRANAITASATRPQTPLSASLSAICTSHMAKSSAGGGSGRPPEYTIRSTKGKKLASCLSAHPETRKVKKKVMIVFPYDLKTFVHSDTVMPTRFPLLRPCPSMPIPAGGFAGGLVFSRSPVPGTAVDEDDMAKG